MHSLINCINNCEVHENISITDDIDEVLKIAKLFVVLSYLSMAELPLLEHPWLVRLWWSFRWLIPIS